MNKLCGKPLWLIVSNNSIIDDVHARFTIDWTAIMRVKNLYYYNLYYHYDTLRNSASNDIMVQVDFLMIFLLDFLSYLVIFLFVIFCHYE